MTQMAGAERATGAERTGEGASHSVYRGILHALETGAVVPGQRLIESELSDHFGVGRNAVREAMQRLAARGVVDLSRNRSASIRQMDIDEAMEVLDVAGAMIVLLFAAAARNFARAAHAEPLGAALAQLRAAHADGGEVRFSRARRGFYRIVLKTAANRELIRIFPAIGTHIMNAKFQSRRLQSIRMRNYERIAQAIAGGDEKRAAALARKHTEEMRAAFREHAVEHEFGRPRRVA